MKDKILEKARRIARKQAIFAKHNKGIMSGEKAATVQRAIRNSRP